MKKTLFLIIVLIALATSCDPVTYDTFCTISGTVLDLDSGDPIQSAVVTLTPGGYNTYTGSDGCFEFLDLDAGRYTVMAQKTGYVTNHKEVTAIAGSVVPIKLTLQLRD